MWRTIIILFLCLPCEAATYYVTTNGLAGNSGAINSPISLVKALGTTSPAVAGDLIYVRGGTYTNLNSYTSQLSGANGNPITVMGYPGERAIIDGNFDGAGGGAINILTVLSNDVNFINLEVTDTYTNRGTVNGRPTGIVMGDNAGPALRIGIINCFIHDCGVGIFGGNQATNCFYYGNVIPNIGYQNVPPDRGHGHGIYIQNSLPSVQLAQENIVPNCWDVGMQIFEQGGANVQGIGFIGNVSVNSGAVNDTTLRTVNFVEYSSTKSVQQVTNLFNFSYHFPGADTNSGIPDGFDIGSFGGPENSDITFSNNYSANGLVSIQQFTNVTLGVNTILTSDPNTKIAFTHPGAGTNKWTWDGNTLASSKATPFDFNGFPQTFASWQSVSVFFDANSSFASVAPTTNNIFVRTNAYQSNRANIIVYNWTGTNNVNVNLSGFVAVGTPYTLRNAFDYGGNPVSVSTYVGGSITIPMTNLNVAAPFGVPAAPSTFPKFGVFVLVPTVGATNTAASCSFTDVQTAVSLSNPGDTVLIPSGTCDYVYNVVVTNNINIIGVAGQTIIRDAITNSSDQSASACFNANAKSSQDQFVMSFAGLTFITAPSQVNNFFESGNIHIDGTSSRVRIYNNVFNDGLNIGIGWFNCFGCIDHNYFAMSNFKQPGKIHHGNYGGNGSNGDGAWILPPWTNGLQEDSSAVYVENNNHTNTTGTSGLGWDSDSGARVVYRSNILDRVIIGGHGTETTGRARGSRIKDIYNNIFNNHGDSECGHFRSGTGVIVSNTVNNSSTFITIRAYRLDSNTSPWGQAIGTNAWDNNNPTIFGSGQVAVGGGGSMTDNTQNWTANQWQGFSVFNSSLGGGSWVINNTANSLTYNVSTFGTFAAFNAGNTYQFRQVITVLDEPGRGKGNLININSPAWPNEALEPINSWSNTFNNVTGTTLNNGGYYPVVNGQELVNGINTNWVPFIYPHPLVSGLLAPPGPPGPGATQIARVTLLRVGNTKTGP